MDQDILLDFQAMRDVDIRTVDPDTLADIRDVKIDAEKPLPERMLDFINQMGSPYCFRCGKITVKVSFAKTNVTIEECIEGYFRSL